MTATYGDRLQGVASSLAIKAPVRVATLGNIILSGLQVIDGVMVEYADRVLVKSQINAVDNGIWIASSAAWTRALDWNGARDVVQGTQVYVVAGATLANSSWGVTTASPVIGETEVTIGLVSAALQYIVDLAQTAATEADTARDEAVLYGGVQVDTFAELQALTSGQVAVGKYVRNRKTGDIWQRVASGGHIGPALAVSATLNWEVQIGRFGATLTSWGVNPDGVQDNAVAVQAAVDAFPAGMTFIVPHGTVRLENEIVIRTPNIRFVGTGRRKVYPGVFVPGPTTPSTFMPVHSNTCAFRFFNATINMASSFSASGINVATLETGAVPVCAFGFDGSGNFHRDYTFDRVGVHGFTSGWDTYNTGGDLAFGLIKIIDCTINRNNWIARNLTGQWNGFVFERNEAGQNGAIAGRGGIDIKAQACSIKNNALEGQRDTIRVTGNYRGLEISGNYFEVNSGDYVISLVETVGARIGVNFWQSITATEPLQLRFAAGTVIDDNMSPSCDAVFDLTSKENAFNPVPLGRGAVAMFADPSMISSMLTGVSEVGLLSVTAPAGPHYSIPDSAGTLYTSTGTGIRTVTKGGLSIASGNYIGVAIAISYKDDPAIFPQLELRVNSGITDGYYNAQFYNFNRTTRKIAGNTIIYYGVIRATAAVTSMQVFYYPFGLNPVAGLVCYESPVAIYDLGAALPANALVGAMVKVKIPVNHVQTITAAPLVGTWPAGYRILARAPASGNPEGFRCTVAGTPGTWLGFGVLL